MEGQFHAVAAKGRFIYDRPDHLEGYAHQFDGKRFVITYKEVSSLSEKQKMYNYLHGPVVDATVMALTHDGWEGVDEDVAEEYLMSRLASKKVYNAKKDEVMTTKLSKRKMNKTRLLKLITDAIHLLETEHATIVMDADEYKQWKISGEKMEKVKRKI